MVKIELYCSGFCFYCVMAERFLQDRDLEFTVLRIDEDAELRNEMMKRSQRQSVPQIFINDQHVGGYTDLVQLDKDGGLEDLLKAD